MKMPARCVSTWQATVHRKVPAGTRLRSRVAYGPTILGDAASARKESARERSPENRAPSPSSAPHRRAACECEGLMLLHIPGVLAAVQLAESRRMLEEAD